MTRVDALTWVLTGTTVVASVFWVMRSDRHRTAAFELDCTTTPAVPDGVRPSLGTEGVTLRWQLDRDPQIATSYLVEVGSAPGSKLRPRRGASRRRYGHHPIAAGRVVRACAGAQLLRNEPAIE